MAEMVFDPSVVISHCLILQKDDIICFVFSNDKELKYRQKEMGQEDNRSSWLRFLTRDCLKDRLYQVN